MWQADCHGMSQVDLKMDLRRKQHLCSSRDIKYFTLYHLDLLFCGIWVLRITKLLVNPTAFTSVFVRRLCQVSTGFVVSHPGRPSGSCDVPSSRGEFLPPPGTALWHLWLPGHHLLHPEQLGSLGSCEKLQTFKPPLGCQLRFDISRHGRHGRHGRHAWLSGLWARCESPGFQGVDANSTAVSERLYQNGSPCWTNQILIAEIAGLPNVYL